MKKIIYHKIPHNEDGKFLVSIADAHKYHEIIQNILSKNNMDNDYVVITGIGDMNILDENGKIINIDSKEYSYNELKEILEWYSR